MLLRLILVLTVIFSFQYNGNGQYFKERFGLGIQTEFSIRPSSEFPRGGHEFLFDKSITSRFFEIGLVANWELSNRFNFVLGTEYRKLNRSSLGTSYTASSSNGNILNIEERHFWDYDYKSNTISITFGLNYEMFKFSKFDLILHAAYGKNTLFKRVIDFQYLISDVSSPGEDSIYETVSDARHPNYVNENFDSLEAGVGMKFDKISYEIIISSHSENVAGDKPHYGCRIRYLFL